MIAATVDGAGRVHIVRATDDRTKALCGARAWPGRWVPVDSGGASCGGCIAAYKGVSK